MKTKVLHCLAVLLGFCCQAQCATNVTLAAGAAVTNGVYITNMSLSISTGQVAKVLHGNVSGIASLNVTVGGIAMSYGGWELRTNGLLPIVAGPATFTMLAAGAGHRGFCTIEVSTPSESFVPGTAVVIPADSGGPVSVILESSTDLITWTAALPGTYGTTSTNRFFRVRAERKP